MDVSVIVPARDAAATLGSTLTALAGQRSAGAYEVLVVDDGSVDATAAIADAHDGVRVLRQPARGPTSARNLAAAAATGRVLAFTDADCEPAPGWLAAGVRALGMADVVQGRVIPDPRRPPGPFDRTVSVDGLSGFFESANLFATRAAFEAIGGFEEWLRPARGKALAEDVWFGWKARRAGHRIAFCDAAIVYHAVFARGPLGFAAERRRLRHFPAIAAKVPELRRERFFARVFLNRRSAAFDAALAALALAGVARSPVPLIACGPYAWIVLGTARSRRAALAGIVADAIGAASLARGSAAARSLLI